MRFNASTWLARRVPFYYGWIMLPIATLAFMATAPGQTFGVSVFNPSIRAALGISQTALTGAYGLGTFLAALPQSYIGALMDRFGIRRVILTVVVLVGVACLFTSQVRNLFMLFAAFFMLRMMAQGGLSLLANNALSMWFDRRLGTVQGIYNLGGALAIAIFPPFILWLINSYGWRTAYALLGVLVVVILFPLILVAFHNRPEDLGLALDGAPVAVSSSSGSEAEPAPVKIDGFTLQEAARTPAYWIMMGMQAITGLIITAVFFNVLPLFESLGLSEETAAYTFTLIAASLAVMQLVGGLLADLVPPHILIAVSMAGLTASMVLLVNTATAGMAAFYALMIGGSQGLFGAAISPAWARYYGRRHLGKIRGTVWTAAVMGTSLGPFIMGATFDLLGSYTLSIWIFAALFAPFIILALFARPPQPARMAPTGV